MQKRERVCSDYKLLQGGFNAKMVRPYDTESIGKCF